MTWQRLSSGIVGLIGVVGGCGSEPSATDDSVASVMITPATLSLSAIQDTARLTASARTASGASVPGTATWSSLDPNVASVESSGLVRANAVGDARIVARIAEFADTAQVNVAQSVAQVSVTPASDSVLAGANLQLAAQAKDKNAFAIAGSTFTWTSSAPTIASVDGSGRVTGLSAGTAQISARSGTVSGTAAVKVKVGPLALVRDTSLSGTIVASNISVARGTTVTATGTLRLQTDGAVEIRGTVRGNCTRMEIRGNTLEVTGSVTNVCSAPNADGEPLVLRALGAIDFDSATVESSGDITVSNIPEPTSAFLSSVSVRATAPCRYAFSQLGRTGLAPAGPNSSPNGIRGSAGARRDVSCSDTLTLIGTKVYSEGGGAGGKGVSSSTAQGGDGGAGGDIRLESPGDIRFQASSLLHAQPGGRGGEAIAGPGAPAMATGGNAGAAGKVTVAAGGRIIVDPAGLTVVLNEPVLVADVPNGKIGGKADATGLDGADATATEAAKDGEKATGVGGKGGDLVYVGSILSATQGPSTTANVTFVVGKSGDGGAAVVTGGTGGKGNRPFPTGGGGGGMVANAGTGGRVDAGIPGLGTPGDGGWNEYHGGKGGLGFVDCMMPWTAGGVGGIGGTAEGFVGNGGTGTLVRGPTLGAQLRAATGVQGQIVLSNAGNGGDGGAGAGPGIGGKGGTKVFAASTTVIDDGKSFKPGNPGTACVAQVAATGTPVPGNPHDQFAPGYRGPRNISIRHGSVIFTSTAPWITVTAPSMDAQGNFVATGLGTYAGFTGIDATMTGKILFDATGQITGIDAILEIGKNGKLPGGQPSNYTIK